MKRKLVILAALASLVLAGQAQAQSTTHAAPAAGAAAVAREWVGRVAGSDLYVAVQVAKNGKVLAYVCDGKSGKPAKWYAWFRGKAKGNQIDLRADGYRLRAKLTRTRTTGTVALPNGRALRFDARPARGAAGLYQLNTSVQGLTISGGWIHLNDGSIRGRCVGCPAALETALVTDETVDGDIGGGGTGGFPTGNADSVPPLPPSQVRSNPCAGTACDNLSCQQLSNLFYAYQNGFKLAKTKQLKDAYALGMAGIVGFALGKGC